MARQLLRWPLHSPLLDFDIFVARFAHLRQIKSIAPSFRSEVVEAGERVFHHLLTQLQADLLLHHLMASYAVEHLLSSVKEMSIVVNCSLTFVPCHPRCPLNLSVLSGCSYQFLTYFFFSS